jgi:hypothetical protein
VVHVTLHCLECSNWITRNCKLAGDEITKVDSPLSSSEIIGEVNSIDSYTSVLVLVAI